MTKGIFIVGTDTDTGKTIVTSGLMHVMRSNGYNATYFKAALSGAIEVGNDLIPGDTKIVSEVGDLHEDYENITPYVYRTAVSPHLASKIEEKPININVIKEKFNYLKEKYDYIIMEGSGGILCPLIDDENGIYGLENLIKDLNMSVILVARAGLGTINHTVLTVKYMESLGINIKGIIMNNYIDNLLYNNNIEMIKKITKLPIIGKLENIKNIEDIENVENINDSMVSAIRTYAEKSFNVSTLEECMDEL